MRRALVLALISFLWAAGPVQAEGEDVLLAVPYRTQLDRTPYAGANCGPAAIGMALAAFGVERSTHELRLVANKLQGSYGYDDGIAIEVLAQVVERHELSTLDLRNGQGFRRWTLDDAREHLREGHPVIPQVWYRALPGRWTLPYQFDHYVVLVGTVGEDFLYHEPADDDGPGAARRISALQLTKAWRSSDVPWAAFAVGPPGESPLRPRQRVPEQPAAEATSVASAAGRWPLAVHPEGDPSSPPPDRPVLSGRGGRRAGAESTDFAGVDYEWTADVAVGRAGPPGSLSSELPHGGLVATLVAALRQLVAPLLGLRG